MRLQYYERVDGTLTPLTLHLHLTSKEEAEAIVYKQHREEQTVDDTVWILRDDNDPKESRPLAIWAKAKGLGSMPESVQPLSP